MQAIFNSHVVIDNWCEDLVVLKQVSDAFMKRDLSMLTSILKEISMFDCLRTLTPLPCIL